MLLQSSHIAWVTPVTQALDLNSLSRILFPLTQGSQGMPGKSEERVSVFRGSRVKLKQLTHHTPRGKYPRERTPIYKGQNAPGFALISVRLVFFKGLSSSLIQIFRRAPPRLLSYRSLSHATSRKKSG